jgi:hypothetical protein
VACTRGCTGTGLQTSRDGGGARRRGNRASRLLSETDETTPTEPEEQELAAALPLDGTYETRLTPVEAVSAMHLRVPARGNRKLRRLLEAVEGDSQLKAWWHVANVNAVVRLEINDHSWVHVQIVTNIALKLLRQLTKHRIEPSLVSDFRMTAEDAEIVVVLAALLHDVGMSVHRENHEDFSLFLAEPKIRELLEGIYDEPDRTVVVWKPCKRSSATARTASHCRSRRESCVSQTRSTWQRGGRAFRSSAAPSPSTRSPRQRSTRYGSRTARPARSWSRSS